MIRDVTDLDVYNDSLMLLRKLYPFLLKIPKAEYDTVIQCKKCGKSIPANIAEGFAKRASEAEFKRFFENLHRIERRANQPLAGCFHNPPEA